MPHLDSQDAKDDEKGTTDEDNVANGSKRGEEGLDDQLQSWSTIDDSVVVVVVVVVARSK